MEFPVVKYLHTMIRISDPEATLGFFEMLGLEEVRRMESEKGRFTLYFLAAPGQHGVAELELTYNWPPEDGSPAEEYTGGRNFGHLAYRVRSEERRVGKEWRTRRAAAQLQNERVGET